MFALATLSSLLYVWHTTFHLSRYLKSLQKDTRRLSDNEEPSDTTALSAFGRIKNFASQKTVKTLSGNLQRLQLSVALIALSFLCKAFLYVLLAVLLGLPIEAPVFPSNFTAPFILDRFLCFYSSELRIAGRTIWGSPLVIPLFTLFCDPFLTMYAALSFLPSSPAQIKSKQCTNHLEPRAAAHFDLIYAHCKTQPHLRRIAVCNLHFVQDIELPVVGLKEEAEQKCQNQHQHCGCYLTLGDHP
jgi:hypothetical protein